MMLKHLKELAVDTEIYGWVPVKAYHAVWRLQWVENGRANWADSDGKMEFRGSLVWHSAFHGSKAKQQPTARSYKKPTRETLNNVVLPTPQTCACTHTFNYGKCTTQDEHPKELHICSYYLVVAKRQCAH